MTVSELIELLNAYPADMKTDILKENIQTFLHDGHFELKFVPDEPVGFPFLGTRKIIEIDEKNNITTWD